MGETTWEQACDDLGRATKRLMSAIRNVETAKFAYATGPFDPAAQVAMQRAIHEELAATVLVEEGRRALMDARMPDAD